MLDPRVIFVIALLGIGAMAAKVLDLYRWYVDEEPIAVDTQTNGGVSSSALNAKVRQR